MAASRIKILYYGGTLKSLDNIKNLASVKKNSEKVKSEKFSRISCPNNYIHNYYDFNVTYVVQYIQFKSYNYYLFVNDLYSKKRSTHNAVYVP